MTGHSRFLGAFAVVFLATLLDGITLLQKVRCEAAGEVDQKNMWLTGCNRKVREKDMKLVETSALLVVTRSATLVVTGALLVVTRSY